VDRAEHDLSLLLARDPQLLTRALRLGLTGDHFAAGPRRERFAHLERHLAAGTDVDWSRMGAEARELVAGLLDDPVDLGDPDEIFEAASRRLLFRSHRGRLREIDRELKLADTAQQRRLLVEKQTLAAEMREAGEAAAFMPNLFEGGDANGQGTIPAGSRSR
jgi:hypothetical protein